MSVPIGEDGFRMERVRLVTRNCNFSQDAKCIVYWMSRDQRAADNWALLYARSLAKQRNVPLFIIFNLVPRFLEATLRQYGFMLRGLHETARKLANKRIPFHLLHGLPKDTVPEFAKRYNAAAVVCDMSPLRTPLAWVKDVGASLDTCKIPLLQVDAHNVIPVWHTSQKQEYSARTIRPKIHKSLDTFLQPFPELEPNSNDVAVELPRLFDVESELSQLEIDKTVLEVDWATPGHEAGMQAAESFGQHRLAKFDDLRNNPNENACSNLSPYFHFGQISVAAVILMFKEKFSKKAAKGVQTFLEEAVVRREDSLTLSKPQLADNFCFYNRRYDSIDGAPAWARDSHDTHRNDKREYIYSRDDLENARTHEDIWNAAQLQMVKTGKMHGFLRMYWAKKILEWTESPEQALSVAVYLNDRYELDGRDPNGYVGCMWSIAGVHDQGWAERSVFGKIRYMNYGGCKRKFDLKKFVARYPPALENAAQLSSSTTKQPTLKQSAKRTSKENGNVMGKSKKSK